MPYASSGQHERDSNQTCHVAVGCSCSVHCFTFRVSASCWQYCAYCSLHDGCYTASLVIQQRSTAKGVPKQASKHHTTDHNACEHCSWWVNLLPTEAQQQCKRGHASSCTCNTAAQHCLRHPLHATQQHTSSRCARQTALERQDLSCTYLAHHELESNVTITTAAQRCLKSPMHVTGTTGGAGDSAE